MSEPHLTPDMIQAIMEAAQRFDANPQTVLRRMVFSYAGKYAGDQKEPDLTNVVLIKEGR